MTDNEQHSQKAAEEHEETMKDLVTSITGNHVSTSDEDVFGDLGDPC